MISHILLDLEFETELRWPVKIIFILFRKYWNIFFRNIILQNIFRLENAIISRYFLNSTVILI